MDAYDVIRKPLLTEKSTQMRERSNQYCFEVNDRANKIDIKKAVEQLFNVEVLDVRTMQYMGKTRRVGRSSGRRRNWKKAVVKIKEGMSIELFEGV